MIKLNEIRHSWPENTNFEIDRPSGHKDYTFIHFEDPVLIRINDKEYITTPHACIIYTPSFPQYYKTVSSLIHDWFHFEADSINIFSSFGLPANEIMQPIGWDYITRTVREMELEFISRMPYSDTLICSKATELFIKLSRAVSGDIVPSADQAAEPRLRKLRAKVFSSLSHQWTVPEMASEIDISVSRFYSLYRTTYGTSPTSDLIVARIDAAKNLLACSSRSITDIADSLGYSNVTHFMRQFRAATGTSPNKYREQSRSGL